MAQKELKKWLNYYFSSLHNNVPIPKSYMFQKYVLYKSGFHNNTYVSAFRPTVEVRHPHTTWLHYNSTEVNNIFETPVTHEQILGRSLTHAFTLASAYAKQIHGVCIFVRNTELLSHYIINLSSLQLYLRHKVSSQSVQSFLREKVQILINIHKLLHL